MLMNITIKDVDDAIHVSHDRYTDTIIIEPPDKPYSITLDRECADFIADCIVRSRGKAYEAED